MVRGLGKFIWNPTSIDEATYCRKKWWLIHRQGVAKPITGAMAKGIVIHKAAENLYKKDPDTGKYVFKYHSAESFANAIAGGRAGEGKRKGGWWNFIVARGTIQNKEIKWRDKSEPWILREEIWRMCYHLYEKLSKEPAPVYIEYEIQPFKVDELWFNGRIDQILYGPKIIDIKSGRRVPNEMKLKYDPQFTLYCLAVGNLCHKDKNFAKSLGVTEEEARHWGGNPIYLSDKIEMEYLMPLEEKKLKMTRDDIRFYDFIEMVSGIQKELEEGRIYSERGRLCDYCEINQACDEITSKNKGKLIVAPQIEFKFFPLTNNKPSEGRIGIQRTLYSNMHMKKIQEINKI